MEKENSTFQGFFTRLAADNQKFIEYRKFQGFCLKRWQYSQKQNWKVKKGRFTYFYVFNISYDIAIYQISKSQSQYLYFDFIGNIVDDL